jgi:exosortase
MATDGDGVRAEKRRPIKTMKKREKQSLQAKPARRTAAGSDPSQNQFADDPAQASDPAANGASQSANKTLVALACTLAIVFAWAYWPVILLLTQVWESHPDYSHGWLVVPAALYFLWARRAQMPQPDALVSHGDGASRRRGRAAPRREGFAWGGLAFFVLGLAVWLAGSVVYVDSLQGWSIPFWVAGAVWLLAGRRMLVWALPAIFFLAFMIPLPFKGERLLSVPLQACATEFSCWILQCLGEPAITEGNVVLLGDHHLNVIEACSGLRIFISIMALAYVYFVLAPRPWWTKVALVVSILPVSLLVNAMRIALTGLLKAHISSEAAHTFGHDLAGWLMLPMAAGLLWCVVWFVGKLIVEVQVVTSRELRQARGAA